jgi:hypothetical protein
MANDAVRLLILALIVLIMAPVIEVAVRSRIITDTVLIAEVRLRPACMMRRNARSNTDVMLRFAVKLRNRAVNRLSVAAIARVPVISFATTLL